jgi:hypothetical protein
MSREQEKEVMMRRLNNLANAANKATDKGMKQIFTDKWYALVKTYGQKIQKEETFKENVKANERLNG